MKVSLTLCVRECQWVSDFRVLIMFQWSRQSTVYTYFHVLFMVSFFVPTTTGLWGFKTRNMLNLLEYNFKYWSWILQHSKTMLINYIFIDSTQLSAWVSILYVNKDCSNTSVAIWMLLFISFPFSCFIRQARNLLMEEQNMNIQSYWRSLSLLWKNFKDALQPLEEFIF